MIHITGILIAICSFIIIGIFHPIVIKTEYYTGTRYWWVFLVLGVFTIIVALFIAETILSSILGVLGATMLWTIKELFEQRERVKKGWFPKNPKREKEY